MLSLQKQLSWTRLIAFSLVLIFFSDVITAQFNYQCPAESCASSNCRCAANTAPDGLSREDTPQFITITVQGALNFPTFRPAADLMKRVRVKNGCPAPITHFTPGQNSDCDFVRRLRGYGAEMATFSYMQRDNPSFIQVDAGVRYLADVCGIPRSEIRGFRAPGQSYSDDTLDHVARVGLEWDASIEERPPSMMSPSKSRRLFPYTMNFGVPQPACTCTLGRTWPMWEVPMQVLARSGAGLFSALNPEISVGELKDNFDAIYGDTRAPFGVYLTAEWLNVETNLAKLSEFLDYAKERPNVHIVTISDLVDWMKNPRKAADVAKDYPKGCGAAQGNICRGPPTVNCGQGTFDWDQCTCKCNEGLCPNYDGACYLERQEDGSCPDVSTSDASKLNPGMVLGTIFIALVISLLSGLIDSHVQTLGNKQLKKDLPNGKLETVAACEPADLVAQIASQHAVPTDIYH